jgi:hypothetical protein
VDHWKDTSISIQAGVQAESRGSHVLSDMDDDGIKFVQPIRIIRIIDGIKQSQLHWECDPIGEFDVFLKIVLILEPLKVQRQDIRKFLNLHSLFSFLKIAAAVAEELVFLA